MPRPLRALLAGAALLAAGALASSASAAAFSYDAPGRVVTLTGGAGETIGIETTGPGEYLVSATTSGQWAGTPRAGLFADPTGSGGVYTLSIDSTVVPLDGIEIVDNTGAVTVSVAGGSDPYVTPVGVTLNNMGSVARIDRSSGDPISFGSTTLAIDAPSIIVMNSITDARFVSLEAVAPILLGNGGSEPTSKTITASGSISTTPINGNGKDLVVNGRWLTEGVSAAHTIRAESGLTMTGSLSATDSVRLGELSVTGPAYPPLGVTAPGITLLGAVHQTVGCAGAEISCRSFDAASPATGAGLKLTGAVSASGSWTNMGNIEVTGTTHLASDVSDLWTVIFGDTVYLSGATTRTIQADNITAREGIQDASSCIANTADAQTACNNGIASLPIQTSHLVVDGEFGTRGSTYLPGDITLKRRTTVLGGTPSGTASLHAGGTLNIAGGLAVLPTGSAFLTGATTILAGMPLIAGAGSVHSATACESGPVTVTGNLRVTAPIECVGTLTAVLGTTTIGADVTSDGHQSYVGPTEIALGANGIRLRSESGALVNFPEGGVSASWAAAPGDIETYTAVSQPSNTSCIWVSGPLTCAFGGVPSASDIRFSVTATARPAATQPAAPKAAAEAPLPTGRTTRRTAARGSRTPLTRLIVPPVSRGKRTWSEKGPCTIRAGRLVAPRRAATCAVTLKVARYRRTPAWVGRATVTIR